MIEEKIFWGIVIGGAVLIAWVTWPKKSANVLRFKKVPKRKQERSHLDTIYNPKQYRRPRR
ncbi:hypothetical protein [Comamonas aquatica]|uniref:hypothetical protein n=1 Tax=Comamonas aquatica TaxID=225991 RepID=UPI0005A6578E|nr:hypothetical protein [Comamonas aquatica]